MAALAIDRAVKPVFHRGRQVGEQRRYNDRLLMAAIRRLGPPPSPAATAAMLEAALEALCPTPARVETPNQRHLRYLRPLLAPPRPQANTRPP